MGYVPGLQPDKWLQRWRERHQVVPVSAELDEAPLNRLARGPGDEGFDLVFLRESDDAPRSAPPGLLRIPLYRETMVVLAARGHEIGAFDELDRAELDGEQWLDPVDTVTATLDSVRGAVELVAANAGLLVLPQPYARVLGRRDVVARPVTGVAATRMGVAWAVEREGDEQIDAFVGIVRGRTAASSRGRAAAETAAGGGPGPRGHGGDDGRRRGYAGRRNRFNTRGR